MKLHGLLLAGFTLVVTVVYAPSADAQLLWRWFGSKSGDAKNGPAKTTPAEARRLAEINVEIAWLADPVTFPFYLEARASSARLDVRGYVPNKAVREHALRIAQVHSTLPVHDGLKEHASLQIKTTKMSTQQLQASAQSSLRSALPRQHQQLKVECGADGKIFVTGSVHGAEDKLAISNALRRLHGCTSVQNLTTTAAEVAQNVKSDKTPIVKTGNTKTDKPMAAQDNKSKPWLQWPWSKNASSKDEPPLLETPKKVAKGPAIVEKKTPPKNEGPILIENFPELKPPMQKETQKPIKVEPPTPSPKTPLSAGELRKRILAACPNAKSVDVQMGANQEVRITLEIRSENEITTTAERVFALPELENYRPDLQFKIVSP